MIPILRVLAIGCVVIGLTAIGQCWMALNGKSKKEVPRPTAIAGIVLGVGLVVVGIALPWVASRF